MKKLLIFTFVFFSSYTHAYIDCVRPVSSVYYGTESYELIYIKHGDGRGISRIRHSYLSSGEAGMDKMLSLLLSAGLAGKELKFRYFDTDDGSSLSCQNKAGQHVNGLWIIF